MEAYKRWVRQNKEYIQSLETLANGLTWVLPDQFLDSEIGPEAVTSILGIITSINAHIIDTTPTQDVTDSIEAYSFPYSLCLSVLMCLETLVEVVAEQYYGDDKKWNFLVVTEATKALVRLSLFRKSGYKMLLSGVETSNDETNSNNSNSQDQTSLKPGLEHTFNYMKNNHSPNPYDLEGRALFALSRFGENAKMMSEPVSPSQVHHNQHREPVVESPGNIFEFLLAVVLLFIVLEIQLILAQWVVTVSMIERPRQFDILSKRGLPGALFLIGEVLFITRPLVYVLFIRKYSIRSWTPWFISMAFDCIGMSFLSLAATAVAGWKEQTFHLSASERDEVKRRKLLFALYIMRDPFFSKYTREKLQSVEKVLEPVPVIGFLSAKAVELAIGVQTRYTYMSGS